MPVRPPRPRTLVDKANHHDDLVAAMALAAWRATEAQKGGLLTNPVAADLARSTEEYRWFSAWQTKTQAAKA